ncbi:O-antigen ligase family protein [Shewanella olleyana]|uniref:O-antigen ligase family protein n=1 Tax=Shewanella olleyana TaxID=135626 RepID=UPI00200C7147|nr:O-antigen ligase family protein [Shewanella olleyana]MCL1065348.1 O-antigen ligase family protein [Shewanella olleyana]
MVNSFYIFSPLLFYVVFLRASLDPVLNLTKIAGIGMGAVLNLVVVCFFIVVCFIKKFELPKSFFKVWGVFVVVGLVSILISPDKLTSARSFFSVLTYFAIFCLTYYFVKTKNDFSNIVKLVVYSSVIPFCFVFKEFIFPEASITKDGFRLFASFSHPNIFAFYLVLVISMCFYSFKSKVVLFDYRFIYHAKLILSFSILCLLFTKTRSAWAALIFVFVVFGVLSDRKYLLYLIILGMAAMLIPSIQDRVLDIFNNQSTVDDLEYGESLNSLVWRKIVWAAAWDYIIEKPLLGHGYDTFSYYFLEFFPLEGNTKFDAHNAYVQIAFDMGFIGVIGFLIIFAFMFVKMAHFYRIDSPGTSVILGLVLSYLLVCYSDNMCFYLSYNWYFWLIMGAYFYMPLDEEQKYSEKNERNF